ncbi:microsomal triglyceride transfer protein large subunit-like [Brachyhypopomus gauderio]|uniref:microsomal triglyceride transfer protein large subunit-like n=1 Tax=Brachyhypopomus gauderio TaxID=698409 RepID=UPI0040426173
MKSVVYLTFCLFFLSGIRNGIKGAFSKALHFDAGLLYEYHYDTSVTVAPVSVELGEVTAITMEAVIQIHSLWRNHDSQEEQLLHLRIRDFKLKPKSNDSITKHLEVDEMLGYLDHMKKPFLVHIHSGKIQGVFDTSMDNTVSLNLKKGLVSLLQIQSPSGVMMEDDATGRCQVSYYSFKDEIVKVKEYESCEKNVGNGMFSDQILGVRSVGTSQTVFNMVDHNIKTVTSHEFRSLVLDEQTTVGIQISSRQLLQLLSTTPDSNKESQGSMQELLSSLKENFVNHSIHAVPVVTQQDRSGYPISKLLDHLKVNIMDQSTTAKVFLRLSKRLRTMETTEIRAILTKADDKLVPVLIDAAAAASTPASLDALVSYINVTNPKTAPLLEKLLYACAFSSQPSTHLINTISHILSQTSEQTHELALIVLGTVIRKMCSANMCNLQEVKDAKQVLLEGVNASKDETELRSYLLAFKSALLPETVPILLEYIDVSNSLSSIVLSALQGFPSKHITKEVKAHVRDIFTQRKKRFTAHVRLAAAQLLLTHDPLHTDVREVIQRIAKEKPEISKFLTSKIMSLLSSDHPARKVILKVLKESKQNNYFHLGRVGSSSSYTGLMAETKDMTTLYDFDFLFSDAGFLKQSNSNFFTQTRGRHLHSLQVSLEVAGLDSLFGGEPGEEEEDEELMAGMSAMMLGVQIQPILFFKGYADLMGKYFSAAEGPMNILSGNILVVDQTQSLILQSGLETRGFFHGALSVDVAADLEFGIFSQESKSLVKNKFSLVVSARAGVGDPLMSTTADTTVEMNSSIGFVTTVNFSDMPVQYCLQLIREPLLYRERTSTQVSSQMRKKTIQQRKRKWTVPGEETALHRDNTQMCRKLLNAE